MTSLMQFITLRGLVRLHLAKAAVMSLKHMPADEQSEGSSKIDENVKKV